MKKRILSVILAVVFVVSTLTCLSLITASADTAFDFGTVAYENFEKMTDAQADKFFTPKDSLATVTKTISNNGENGTKALKIDMKVSAWGWVNQNTQVLNIPENAIGIRAWYSISNDIPKMRFLLKDITDDNNPFWTDIGFVGSAADNSNPGVAGTYDKISYFDGKIDPTHKYVLAIQSDPKQDSVDSVVTLDNITFITTETMTDFENAKTEDMAKYVRYKKGGVVTEFSNTIVDFAGSKALELKAILPYNYAWINYDSEEFIKFTPEVIGMRLTYTLNQEFQRLRICLKHGTDGDADYDWTKMAFVGTYTTQETVAAGTYTETIFLSPTDEAGRGYDPTHNYRLGIQVYGGSSTTADASTEHVITVDNIEYIRYGSAVAGDMTALTNQIAAVKATYDAGSSKWEANSWKVFSDAYTDAKAVTSDFSQRQMDQSAENLKLAFEGLEPAVTDKTTLKKSLDDVKDIIDSTASKTRYTEYTLSNLNKAYKEAKTVYDNDKALQSAVNAQVTALANSCKALKLIPSAEEYIYTATDDYVLADFEAFKDTLDMADLKYELPHIVQIDNSGAITQALETSKAISGKNSLKISWGELSQSSAWPAIRFWGPAGTFRNQALYFDIVCPSDWHAVFVLYGNDESGSPMDQYRYTLDITGSDKIQHIMIPLNEFKNTITKEAWTNSEWNEICNLTKGAVLKMQIDKTGTLEDDSYMILDNIMFVKSDSKPYKNISYNYATEEVAEDNDNNDNNVVDNNTSNTDKADVVKAPKTGDNTNITLIALVAVFAIGALVVSRKFIFSK